MTDGLMGFLIFAFGYAMCFVGSKVHEKEVKNSSESNGSFVLMFFGGIILVIGLLLMGVFTPKH